MSCAGLLLPAEWRSTLQFQLCRTLLCLTNKTTGIDHIVTRDTLKKRRLSPEEPLLQVWPFAMAEEMANDWQTYLNSAGGGFFRLLLDDRELSSSSGAGNLSWL